MGFFFVNHHHSNTPTACQKRWGSHLVLALAVSPFLGSFKAEFINSHTLTSQQGSECNRVEAKIETKASPVGGLINTILKKYQ
jgi:hypothetical protein